MTPPEKAARLVSIAAIATDRWLATFAFDGTAIVFQVVRDASALSIRWACDVEHPDESDSPESDAALRARAEVFEVVQDALTHCGLFDPFISDDAIRDDDFDNTVFGASFVHDLFFVDPTARGRALFDDLLGHVSGQIVVLDDVSDYSAVESVAAELYVVAGALGQLVVGDRPRYLVEAVRSFCTAVADAELDDEGWTVLEDAQRDIRATRRELLDAIDGYFELRRESAQ